MERERKGSMHECVVLEFVLSVIKLKDWNHLSDILS